MTEIIRIDLNGVNSYLAKSESGFILFDTGGHLVMDKIFTNRLAVLQQELEAAGCTEHNLKLIVLTHGDNDHACNAAYLRRCYNAKIAMHISDSELVENPSLRKWMESFRYHLVVYKIIFALMNNTITKVTQKTLEDFEAFSPDILLNDGFDLSEYGLDATVIHLPGHTPGSIGVLTKAGDLIAGDTFTNISKPACAPNAQNFRELSTSLNRIKQWRVKTVYPGHGIPFGFDKL